jgi:putative transcriptional regulator
MRNRIRELRESLKLTQDELATRVEVSRQTVIALEKGRYNPSVLLAHRISRVFGLAIEEVFDFEEGQD